MIRCPSPPTSDRPIQITIWRCPRTFAIDDGWKSTGQSGRAHQRVGPARPAPVAHVAGSASRVRRRQDPDQLRGRAAVLGCEGALATARPHPPTGPPASIPTGSGALFLTSQLTPRNACRDAHRSVQLCSALSSMLAAGMLKDASATGFPRSTALWPRRSPFSAGGHSPSAPSASSLPPTRRSPGATANATCTFGWASSRTWRRPFAKMEPEELRKARLAAAAAAAAAVAVAAAATADTTSTAAPTTGQCRCSNRSLHIRAVAQAAARHTKPGSSHALNQPVRVRV